MASRVVVMVVVVVVVVVVVCVCVCGRGIFLPPSPFAIPIDSVRGFNLHWFGF